MEEEVANVGAPPHVDQVPPLEENFNVDQAPANPQPMTEADMRDIISQMEKSITTQVQAVKVKVQAITTQANRKIAPYPHQQVTTMASCLRDITRMNPPSLYGSKVDEDPKN